MASHTVIQGFSSTFVKMGISHSSSNDLISWSSILHKKKKSCRSLFMKINDVINDPSRSSIDFDDPDWKIHYQDKFEERIRLPHLSDNLNVTPRHTTFSLKNRWLSLKIISNILSIHDFMLLTFFYYSSS